MPDIAPPAPSRPARGRDRLMTNRQGMALMGVTLLLAPVAYITSASGASVPVSAESLVQSTLRGTVHVDANGPSDVAISRLTIKPAQSTVWHSHSTSVVVAVKQGMAAVYRADEAGCTREQHIAGDAFVEHRAQVHAVRNEGSGKLVLYVFSIVPKGSAVSTKEPRPANCDFK